jgi:iron complex outermembrane recepter protein
VKTQLLNDTLRITASLYHYEYTDLQVSNFDAATFSQQILNAGGSLTEGLESSVEWRATPGLTLNGAFGYSIAHYTRFDGIACYNGQTAAEGCDIAAGSQSLTGQRLALAPLWTVNSGFVYVRPLSSNLMMGLTGNLRYSDSYFTEENNEPISLQHGYVIFDASGRLSSADRHWEVAVIGRNLNNKQYITNSYDNPNSPPGTIESNVSRPRQVVLEATARF